MEDPDKRSISISEFPMRHTHIIMVKWVVECLWSLNKNVNNVTWHHVTLPCITNARHVVSRDLVNLSRVRVLLLWYSLHVIPRGIEYTRDHVPWSLCLATMPCYHHVTGMETMATMELRNNDEVPNSINLVRETKVRETRRVSYLLTVWQSWGQCKFPHYVRELIAQPRSQPDY